MWLPSLDQEVTWGRKWKPTPVFMPGKFYGQRSLALYSPWGHKELDMTEQLNTQIHVLIQKGKLAILPMCLTCCPLPLALCFVNLETKGPSLTTASQVVLVTIITNI